MGIERLSEVVERTEELAARFETAATTIEAVLSTGSPSGVDLQDLRGTLEGLSTDTRSLVRDLDAIDELDFALVQDGARTIRVWSWRRLTRSALVAFGGQVRQLSAVAAELAGGLRRKVVVSREGETWQSIAARELGDWREWSRLLAANPTIDPGTLNPGTTLVVPERR